MEKQGADYQRLVALVVKALTPGADVKVGQWIEGPDGAREVDVEVRGMIDGRPCFVLVECKDWGRPVDIPEIDKLDSKKRDLAADQAVLYSRSGFTKKALRKAERLGIEAVSAMSSGDDRAKFYVEREYYAKRRSVDQWELHLLLDDTSRTMIPPTWQPTELRYGGLPIVNWLQGLSLRLLKEDEWCRRIVVSLDFKENAILELNRTPLVVRGLVVDMHCSHGWLCQTVREDVSLGVYDHVAKRIVVPNNQTWSVGWFNRDGWEELPSDMEVVEEPLQEASFSLSLTLYKAIKCLDDSGTPPIDDLIGDMRVQYF